MSRAFWCLLFLFVAIQTSAAQITLSDGSIVYGSITELSEGENLIVDTSHMDEVTIAWDAVVSISEVGDVEIELFDGERIIGDFSVSGSVAVIDGDLARELDPAEIFSITDVKDSWSERITAYTDFGSNVVRGNNQVSQLSLAAGLGIETLDHEFSLETTAIINEQVDVPNTRRGTLSANYAYNLPRNWQAVSYLQYETDEQQNLDGRSILGVGGGKRFINNRRHRLDTYLGVAVNVEQFTDLPREETAEGFVGFNYRWRSWADADVSYYVYPSLEVSNRVRTELDASLSFDLISDLDFKLTVFDRYDSDPPEGNTNNDTGVTMGLSWSY
jgi:putative salt-induced outer membrane protein YdiY